MHLKFELLPGVLRVEVTERETAEETRQLIEGIFAERAKHGVLSVMVVTLKSRPIFKVEDYGLQAVIARVAAIPGLRIAGVATEPDLRSAHEYVTLLASQRGAPMRNFATEHASTVLRTM